MRVVRLRVETFGGLGGLDTGESDLPGIVVVAGPNEAGKSTLFQFLTSILYGFHPASRDANPYTPWSGGDAAGSATIALSDGTRVDVERRLRSQPTGRLHGDGLAEDLRNRPVPWVEHVPRKVFQQVFALTLSDLAGLEVETWARVQERLTGAMGAGDLRPARSVATELEREAGDLWRPNRRGNQRVRLVRDGIADLRRRRREALERDQELRDLVEACRTDRDRLQEAREERQRHRLAVERVQLLVPIRRQLRRIASLQAEAGPDAELEGIPPDPETRLQELRKEGDRLRKRMSTLDRDAEAPSEAVATFGEDDERILRYAEAVTDLTERAAAFEPERARAAALKQEARDLSRRLAGAAIEILRAPPGPDDDKLHQAFERVPLADLKEAVREYGRARDERRGREAELRGHAMEAGPPTPPASLAGSLTVLLSGGLLLALGVGGRMLWVTAAGGMATAAGLAFLTLWWLSRRAGGEDGARSLDERIRQGTERERAKEEAARAEVARLVGDLPMRPSLLNEPDASLASGIQRVQELVRDIADRTEARQRLDDEARALAASARELAGVLELQLEGQPHVVARALDRALRDAERHREAARAARREITRIERERAAARERLDQAEEARSKLRAALAALGGGEVARGTAVARARMDARDRARQLQDELERNHPDLDEIHERIQASEEVGEEWTVEDDALARIRARVEELSEVLERLGRSVEARDKDIAHLRGRETVDAIDGEIAALREDETHLVRRRDRLWVLAHVIREADRRFREEHQPDMVRRASEYLAHVTAGRYDHILVDETAEGDVFSIAGPGLARPVSLAHPVSTGTLEQAYLAMRLGIVDHLDRAGERLPLFVDEVFVNWDARRSRKGAELMATVAQARQVFVFTCHQRTVEILERLGARTFDLGLEGM